MSDLTGVLLNALALRRARPHDLWRQPIRSAPQVFSRRDA
jgi:hypothetical protein